MLDMQKLNPFLGRAELDTAPVGVLHFLPPWLWVLLGDTLRKPSSQGQTAQTSLPPDVMWIRPWRVGQCWALPDGWRWLWVSAEFILTQPLVCGPDAGYKPWGGGDVKMCFGVPEGGVGKWPGELAYGICSPVVPLLSVIWREAGAALAASLSTVRHWAGLAGRFMKLIKTGGC